MLVCDSRRAGGERGALDGGGAHDGRLGPEEGAAEPLVLYEEGTHVADPQLVHAAHVDETQVGRGPELALDLRQG